MSNDLRQQSTSMGTGGECPPHPGEFAGNCRTTRQGPATRATRAILGALGLTAALAARGEAQLRPLEPLPWEALAPGTTAMLRLGAGLLGGQRASLAGTEGRLLELGRWQAAWRTGRVAVELGGTALNLFDDRSRWADPADGAAQRFGRRVDAGELRITTLVRLTPWAWPAAAALRFGARLPTSSHARGLEREETDFLGTLGLAWARGPLGAAAEGGIGIFGTRVPEFTQEDDLVFTARAGYRIGALRPEIVFTGQSSPLRYRHPRGVEDLRELRLGARAGARRWLEVFWVRGLAPFSPKDGILVGVGASVGR